MPIVTQSQFISFVPEHVARRFAGSTKPPLNPERRKIKAAVLFADISGFTPLAESLAVQGARGAEELAALLNRYFGQLITLFVEHGGSVIRFAGDALLVLWQAEDSDLPGAALRAAHCGLLVQQAMGRFAQDAQAQLSLRVGIGAGEVQALYVGGIRDRWECLFTGDPLRQMAVAEHLAQTGDVLMSPEAWTLVADVCRGLAQQDGFVRLESAHEVPLIKAVPPIPNEVENSAISAFVPITIRERLAAGQTEWLSELRRVTVFFLNLLNLELEAPDFLEKIQLAFRTVQTAIDRYEGTIYQLVADDKGTVLVAAFGLPPLAHKDDPVRGVQAADTVRTELEKFGLSCSIGLASGRVFCGIVGNSHRREYITMGNTVNLAARLMMYAKGDILCDEATYMEARHHVALDAFSPISLKGMAKPLPVFTPRRSCSKPSPDSELSARSAMVGRIGERESLNEAIESLLNGLSSVVVVEGDAGMGKSRLVEAFVERATAMGISCLSGSADPIEQASPYFAWRSVMSGLLGIDHAGSSHQSLSSDILERIGRDPLCRKMAPLFRDITGIDLSDNETTAAMTGEARAFSTQDLIVHLFNQILVDNDKPRHMAIIFEDAHWLDSASWALLCQVHRRVRPLLLVIALRPNRDRAASEYREIFDAETTRLIRLQSFSMDDTYEILTRRLGRPPESKVAKMIFECAGGNPFFTVELGHSLVESGIVQEKNGVLQMAPDAPDTDKLSLPDTVEGTVLARIDRLNPRLQLTIKVASVIGRRFAHSLLREIYPMEEDRPHLDRALEELEQMELIMCDMDAELAYLYRHEFIREVAYSLILYSQRRQLHRAVAENLAKVDGENHELNYPRLAYHWARAEDLDKTLFYLEKAGEQAIFAGAYKEAADYFQEALRLQQESVEHRVDDASRIRRAHWERQLGEAMLGLGNLHSSRAALERAVSLLGFPVPNSRIGLAFKLLNAVRRQMTNRLLKRRAAEVTAEKKAVLREAALAYLRLLETYFFLAGTAETFNATLQALNIAEAAGPSPELARSYALTGWIVSMAPMFKLSLLYLRLAMQQASSPQGCHGLQSVQFFTGFALLAVGRLREARTSLEQAVQLADMICDKRRWIEAVCGLSTLLHYEGKFSDRVKMGADVLYTSARRQGDYQAEAWGLLDQIESLLVGLGNLARAMPLIEALVPFLEKEIGRSERIWGFGLYALAMHRLGRHAEASEAARKANAISERMAPVAVYTMEGYAAVAEVFLSIWEKALASNDSVPADLIAEARKACKALTRFAKVFPIALPRSLLCEGLLARLSGRRRRAMSIFKRSLEAATSLSMPFEEARVLYEIGRHLPLDNTERMQHLQNAAEIFDRLDAAFELARTRKEQAIAQ